MLQKFSDAEDMVSVAHRDATTQTVGVHDHSHSHGRFRRIPTLRLRDQIAFRNATVHQVTLAHSPLAEMRIGGSTARSDNYGSYAAVI